jgi:hypothetical protein
MQDDERYLVCNPTEDCPREHRSGNARHFLESDACALDSGNSLTSL